MLRIAVSAALVFLAACTPKGPAPATSEVGPSAQPASAADPASAPAPAAPAPESRMGTMQLSCGGENFRVAFEDTRAVVVNADGSNTELKKLDPQPGSPPGLVSYTDGMMTFAKQGGGDKPTVIRYAKARMAFQDCLIAQN